MKKIFLIVAAPLVATGVTAAISVPLLLIAANPSDYVLSLTSYQAAKSEKATSFVVPESTLDVQNNVIFYNDQADINLYYVGAGTATYTNMLRLALLATGDNKTQSKEVHFAVAANEFEHQGKTDRTFFEDLLRVANPSSSVINVHFDTRGTILKEWSRIIRANLQKRINIWWNSDHVSKHNGASDVKILDLAGFSNVNIHMLEDGAAIVPAMTAFSGAATTSYFQTIESATQFDTPSGYLAPRLFNNVYSWFSNKAWVPYTAQPGNERLKMFDMKALADEVFNTRLTIKPEVAARFGVVAGATRLFRFWPRVTGLDWSDSLKIINQAKAERPSSKALLLLGSYGVANEEAYIRQVWEKYHDQYNIFYKGHPGHSEYSSWITTELIPQVASVGMYVLESAIASEELTRDHISDGLVFDAVISVERTSAMGGFPAPTYDLRQQYLEMYTGKLDANNQPLPIINDPSSADWQAVITWLETSGWLK